MKPKTKDIPMSTARAPRANECFVSVNGSPIELSRQPSPSRRGGNGGGMMITVPICIGGKNELIEVDPLNLQEVDVQYRDQAEKV